MLQAHPTRLWAANDVSTMRLSFSSTRDHRVSVAIRKDEQRLNPRTPRKRFFLPCWAQFAKTRANEP